jgi:hypothetical protein
MAQLLIDHARLDPSAPPGRVDRQDAVHVFREIEHDRDIAGLARETGAAAPAEDRYPALAACRDRRLDVVHIPGDHDADRHLAVNREVGRVERAAAGVETHFARNTARQRLRQSCRLAPMAAARFRLAARR